MSLPTEPAPAAPDGPGAELVVDLDRELLRSDPLHEVAWAVAARDKRRLPALALAALSGRAALCRTLAGADAALLDVARLPCDPAVLERLKQARAAGTRTVLTTAFDPDLARRVSETLGLFDAVRPAAGTGGRRPRRPVPGRALLRTLRPHQWLKNILVFLPMLASHQVTPGALMAACLAFAAFSLIASGVYVLNDLLDLDSDRRHPRKRNRPFASGAVPLGAGMWLAPGLFLAGFALAASLGRDFLTVMLVYLVATSAYSFDLKRRMIVDICTLAGLYTLRIAAGGVATGTVLSVWLLAFSIFFFFALAAVKRKAELVAMDEAGPEKAHGRNYQRGDLPLVSQMAVTAGYISVLVLALYLDSAAVQALYTRSEPLWGICFVLLYWISRTVMLTHRGWMEDDPVVFATRDRISQICGLLIAGLALAAAL